MEKLLYRLLLWYFGSLPMLMRALYYFISVFWIMLFVHTHKKSPSSPTRWDYANHHFRIFTHSETDVVAIHVDLNSGSSQRLHTSDFPKCVRMLWWSMKKSQITCFETSCDIIYSFLHILHTHIFFWSMQHILNIYQHL